MHPKMLILKIFFMFICCVECKFFDFHKDQIAVDVKYFRECVEDSENIYNLHLSTKKFNRTHVGFDMNINVTDRIDERFELTTEMRLWGDGGWKKNFFSLRRKNPCNTAKLILGPLFTTVLVAAHASRDCPIEPGYYYFKDTYFDLRHVPIVVQDGRFYLIGRLFKDNVCYMCVEGEVEVQKVMS